MFVIFDSFPLWFGRLITTWFFGSKLFRKSWLFLSIWFLKFWSSAKFKFDQFVLLDWPEQLELDDLGKLFDPEGQYFWFATLLLFPGWVNCLGFGGTVPWRDGVPIGGCCRPIPDICVDAVLLDGFVLDLWLLLLLLLHVVPEWITTVIKSILIT